MDFSLNDEQQAFREALRRFCDAEYAEHTRGQDPAPVDVGAQWGLFAELGLLGLTLPETVGGAGLGAAETFLAAYELGRALQASRFVELVVMSGRFLQAVQADPTVLEALASGVRRYALAWQDPQLPQEGEALRAMRTADGWSLRGVKVHVRHAAEADALVVVAPVAGEGGAAEPSAFLLPRDAQGVTLVTQATLDGNLSSTLYCDDVRVPADSLLSGPERTQEALALARDAAQAALCAEAAAAMHCLLDLTVEHLRTRQQFGKPLAAFQALQHHVADMFAAVEQAYSISAVAAMAIDEAEPRRRSSLVAAAKVFTDDAARFVGEWAVQLHGAMGMTNECRVAGYVRRLMLVGQRFGSTHHALERYIRLAA